MPNGTPIDKVEFTRLYHEGRSPAEIAEIMGISVHSTREVRRDLNLPTFPERDGRRVDIERLKKLNARGYTTREAAKLLNVSTSAILRAVRRLGLPPMRIEPNNTGGPRPYIDRELIRTLNSEGKTARQISEAVGCSKRMVSRIRRELGISQSEGQHPGYPDEIKAKVLEMLEGGASYKETARTFEIPDKTLLRWFPGYGWTTKQSAEYRSMLKKMEKLDTRADRRVYSNM